VFVVGEECVRVELELGSRFDNDYNVVVLNGDLEVGSYFPELNICIVDNDWASIQATGVQGFLLSACVCLRQQVGLEFVVALGVSEKVVT